MVLCISVLYDSIYSFERATSGIGNASPRTTGYTKNLCRAPHRSRALFFETPIESRGELFN